MFAESPLAAAVLGVLLGTALLAVGIAVTVNRRGWAGRYTEWVDALLPRPQRNTAAERTSGLLLSNRIIFGVIAAFGVGLLTVGVTALAR